MACDLNFASVGVLILADTSGPIAVDDSSNALTLAGPGNSSCFIPTGGPFSAPSPYIDLANVPGGSAPLFGVQITASNGGPVDLSAGDWTAEGWFLCRNGSNFTMFNVFGFVKLNAGITGGNLVATVEGTGGGTGVPMTLNVWHHVAIVMHANAFVAYLDGVAAAAPQAVTRTVWNNETYGVGASNAGNLWPGAFTNFRITKGIARYTANFTPPTAPFPTVACGPATVPNVVGEALATAEADIVAAGFIVGTVTTAGSFTIPAGDVISQNPVGGIIATQGTPVNLVESIGEFVAVPDLTNTSVPVATGILIADHLVLGVITYQPNVLVISGNIISQSIAPSTVVAAGTPISVIVSTGRAGLFEPNVIGLTQSQADLALSNLGLAQGGVIFAPSTTVPSGFVMAQNPQAGTPVASGSLTALVISTGPPAVETAFDFEATVISQYQNSPTILQLVANMNQYIDMTANFAEFFSFVWNIETAQGFGLDILGRIVGVSRLLQIPNTVLYVGFDDGTRTPIDWQTFGSDQAPTAPGGDGVWYSGHNATQSYNLNDSDYRQLILAKAFANIALTSAPAMNRILLNLYSPGEAYVQNNGGMSITFVFRFHPTPVQLAILQQSGVIPVPPGVSFNVTVPP